MAYQNMNILGGQSSWTVGRSYGSSPMINDSAAGDERIVDEDLNKSRRAVKSGETTLSYPSEFSDT